MSQQPVSAGEVDHQHEPLFRDYITPSYTVSDNQPLENSAAGSLDPKISNERRAQLLRDAGYAVTRTVPTFPNTGEHSHSKMIATWFQKLFVPYSDTNTHQTAFSSAYESETPSIIQERVKDPALDDFEVKAGLGFAEVKDILRIITDQCGLSLGPGVLFDLAAIYAAGFRLINWPLKTPFPTSTITRLGVRGMEPLSQSQLAEWFLRSAHPDPRKRTGVVNTIHDNEMGLPRQPFISGPIANDTTLPITASFLFERDIQPVPTVPIQHCRCNFCTKLNPGMCHVTSRQASISDSEQEAQFAQDSEPHVIRTLQSVKEETHPQADFGFEDLGEKTISVVLHPYDTYLVLPASPIAEDNSQPSSDHGLTVYPPDPVICDVALEHPTPWRPLPEWMCSNLPSSDDDDMSIIPPLDIPERPCSVANSLHSTYSLDGDGETEDELCDETNGESPLFLVKATGPKTPEPQDEQSFDDPNPLLHIRTGTASIAADAEDMPFPIPNPSDGWWKRRITSPGNKLPFGDFFAPQNTGEGSLDFFDHSHF